MADPMSNYDELGSLERRRRDAGVSLAALADELKRARQAVAVLEHRDRVAPDRVRPVSRDRYLAALARCVAGQKAEQLAAAEVLERKARQVRAEVLA